MKKLLLVTICILLVFCLVTPTMCLASPATAQNGEFQPYIMQSLKDANGNYYRAQFGGYFFGDSGIQVSIDIYSNEDFAVDFDIESTSLTGDQLARQQKLTAFFQDFYNFITKIDNASNANFDGEFSFLQGGQVVKPQKSELFLYNQAKCGETLSISKDMYDMLVIAQQMYLATNGAYNPAVYRLVDLWGFSSRTFWTAQSQMARPQPYDRDWDFWISVEDGEEYKNYYYPTPEQKYVDAFSDTDFLSFAPTDVVLSVDGEGEDAKYYVTKNVAPVTVDGVEYQQWIDLGGIAKGHVADYAQQKLLDLGISAYNVNVGSSSQSFGDLSNWNRDGVFFEDPYEGLVPVFGVKAVDVNVSVSGRNNRYYTMPNGVTYGHIIDGKKGAPAQTGIEGASVIAPTVAGQSLPSLSAAKCDCLTTALTVMSRDEFVSFVNDTLVANENFVADNNLQISAFYKTLSGAKQVLSNVDKNSILTTQFSTLDKFGWALQKGDDGKFVYDGSVQGQLDNAPANYTTLVVILAIAVGIALVAVVVYYFVKGKYKVAKRIVQSKKDKFFKPADVMVYICVVLAIVVLFSVFLAQPQVTMNVVKVVDMQTDEVLFVYDVARNEMERLDQNVNGWSIATTYVDGKLQITFSREINGSERFNVLTIDATTPTPNAKMTDSSCGFHQDCVRNFGAVTNAGQSIVCSPNLIKVITE